MFEFELALALGSTRKELLNRLDSKELTQWMAFYRLNPWGETRADKRNALLCWLLYSVNCKSKRKVEDFMIVRPPKQPMTAKAMSSLLRSISTKIVKGKK